MCRRSVQQAVYLKLLVTVEEVRRQQVLLVEDGVLVRLCEANVGVLLLGCLTQALEHLIRELEKWQAQVTLEVRFG